MGMPQLGSKALEVFRAGEVGKARIVIPSIVLAELYYLNVKVGQPISFAEEVARLKNSAQFVFVDFTVEDVLRFDQLAIIPEMHDRIIAGVALARQCPCLSRDPYIVNSGIVQAIW